MSLSPFYLNTAFLNTAFINAAVEEIAYCSEMEDRAADQLDGLDFGDRCYYGDKAHVEQLMLERAIAEAIAYHPIVYA